MRRVGGLLAVLLSCAIVLAIGTTPAAADVVTPAGNCVGTGTWQKAGLDESSTSHSQGDTIKIPRSDTVDWTGSLPKLGDGDIERRDIAGKVQLKLPPPFGWVTIDDWDKTSVRTGNRGSKIYDLPSIVGGIKLQLRGEHHESGALYCKGSIKLEIDGSSPLTAGGVAGAVVSLGLGLLAWRAKP